MRRSARKDAWKYHLREMALAEEPLRYLRKYLNVEEDLTEELAAATADEAAEIPTRRRAKAPKPPASIRIRKARPHQAATPPTPHRRPCLPHPPLQVICRDLAARSHFLQRLLRGLLRLRHWIQREALLVVRHRFIQLPQPPSRLCQRQMRLRIIIRQRHRIAGPLVHPFEVAVIAVERRDSQILSLALVGRLVEINPLLRPRRSPSLRSLRCRIRIRIIPQRPRRGITLRRPAAARTRAAGAVPRTPSILQRPTPRSSRRILSREMETSTQSHLPAYPYVEPPAPPACPLAAGAGLSPGNGKLFAGFALPAAGVCPGVCVRPFAGVAGALLLRGVLAVRPEYGLPTLIRKRTATLLLRTYSLPRQHHPNAGAHQPQSPQPAHPLHISIRRHPAPAR